MSLASLLRGTADSLDRRVGWDKLPLPAGLLTLVGLRQRLREENLYDTGRGALDVPPIDDHDGYLHGTHARRDVQRPERPADGEPRQPLRPQRPALVHVPRAARRDARPEPAPRQPRAPDPRRVPARRRRSTCSPGAWIQFEVHDWFSHGKPAPEEPWEIPVADDDPWPEHPMKIPRTHARPEHRPEPAAHVRHRRHALVGRLADLRPRPRLRGRAPLGRERQAPDRRAGPAAAGAREAHRPHRRRRQLLGRPRAPAHALHARAQRDLRRAPRDGIPSSTDQQLYDKGRLINAALMAKIHTVDWTPAIIAHPTTVLALRANWWGLEGEKLDKRFGRKTANEVIRGIPGSPTDHHGVPLLADRGVRRRLPDAPADPGRLQLPLARERRAAARAHARGPRRAPRPRAARRDVDGATSSTRSALASRRDRAPQLPALPADLQPARTGRRSTSPRPTSCARASAASRATTSSAGSST